MRAWNSRSELTAGVPFFFKQRAGAKPGVPSGDAELDAAKELAVV